MGDALEPLPLQRHHFDIPRDVVWLNCAYMGPLPAAAAAAGTQRVADALGVVDAPLGIYELAKQLGAPTALGQLGVAESDLDKVTEMATQASFHNPERVTAGRIRALLQDAFEGSPPARVQARRSNSSRGARHRNRQKH